MSFVRIKEKLGFPTLPDLSTTPDELKKQELLREQSRDLHIKEFERCETSYHTRLTSPDAYEKCHRQVERRYIESMLKIAKADPSYPNFRSNCNTEKEESDFRFARAKQGAFSIMGNSIGAAVRGPSVGVAYNRYISKLNHCNNALKQYMKALEKFKLPTPKNAFRPVSAWDAYWTGLPHTPSYDDENLIRDTLVSRRNNLGSSVS